MPGTKRQAHPENLYLEKVMARKIALKNWENLPIA
jgi:hypothetical protein